MITFRLKALSKHHTIAFEMLKDQLFYFDLKMYKGYTKREPRIRLIRVFL